MSKTENAVIKLNKQAVDTDSKIEVIKNLIFGENIEAYDSEFESLKLEILEKKKILEELIEEVRLDLKAAIDNVSTDVNIRITELEEKIGDRIDSIEENHVTKNTLGKLLIDLGEKVSTK